MLLIATSFLALAKQPAQAPPQPMSFFITQTPVQAMEPILEAPGGADKIAKRSRPQREARNFQLMSARKPERRQRARSHRNGPWYNAKGEKIANNLADLHGDTLELARLATSRENFRAHLKREAPSPSRRPHPTSTIC